MMRIRTTGGEIGYQLTLRVLVAIVTLLALAPLVYSIALSLTGQEEFVEKGGFVIWPARPTLNAYQFILRGGFVLRALLVSVERTVLGTALALLLVTIGGYALSRRDLPGRRAFISGVIVTILVGGGMIPTYVVVLRLGMMDTLWSLIVPPAIDSFCLLVIKQYMERLPRELEDAAEVDGAGELTKLWRICAPMSGPALAAVGLFVSVGHWNSWFDALLYIADPGKMPLQLILRNIEIMADFTSRRGDVSGRFKVAQQGIRMAVVVVGVAPILCVYPFLQKYFTKGVYLGALKG